tara:strand:+ start:4438 stop:4995 length:558 start_codon:yes stop_codon:yes gene_type:complete
MMLLMMMIPFASATDLSNGNMVFMVGGDCTDCYIPSHVVIKNNSILTWHNADSAVHTVTSGSIGQPTNQFNSGLVQPDRFYAIQFVTADVYPYFCMLHPWMEGTVTVEEIAFEEYYADIRENHPSPPNSTAIVLTAEQLAQGMYQNSTGTFYANHTAVVPEFPIVMVVLATAVIGVVVISRRVTL